MYGQSKQPYTLLQELHEIELLEPENSVLSLPHKIKKFRFRDSEGPQRTVRSQGRGDP